MKSNQSQQGILEQDIVVKRKREPFILQIVVTVILLFETMAGLGCKFWNYVDLARF